jgi:D-serine deaminase-like pyridoxal phosphate-dependent protein
VSDDGMHPNPGWPEGSTLALPPGLDTPALVVDLARVEANIGRLQSTLDARGVALRPHAKTHKSVSVGRLQLHAGARGLTVGTLGEAEVFAAAGMTDLFVAYPIRADGPKAPRLRALHDAVPGLLVGVDSAGGATRLAGAVAGSRVPLSVVVEVDPGDGRTGVGSTREALAVARSARAAGLAVRGVFAHGGHGYRPGNAAIAGADEVRSLGEAVEALEADGFEVSIVSAGSTPTMLAAAAGRVTEIRAGTYVYGDRQQWRMGAIVPEGCAAHVAATVVSAFDDRIVLDAGAKSLTKDRADWLPGFGLIDGYPGLLVDRLSDYHGVVPIPPGAARPMPGEVVAIVPNHICPVVDLFDAAIVVRPDGRTERWPVDARGRSR